MVLSWQWFVVRLFDVFPSASETGLACFGSPVCSTAFYVFPYCRAKFVVPYASFLLAKGRESTVFHFNMDPRVYNVFGDVGRPFFFFFLSHLLFWHFVLTSYTRSVSFFVSTKKTEK